MRSPQNISMFAWYDVPAVLQKLHSMRLLERCRQMLNQSGTT